MIKTFSKYFSLILILVLIHSNFSLAITYMDCKMGMEKSECICKDQHSIECEQINIEQSACCKIKVQELNNSNKFEINKLTLGKENSFQSLNYLFPLHHYTDSPQKFKLFPERQKPPADIPILISTLLI